MFVNVWASDARRDLALGSNLLGSLLGGLASVLSMAIGFRALTFLTLAVYVVAGLSMRGVSAATPRRPIRAARHG